MTYPRRTFLKSGVLAAAAAGFFLKPANILIAQDTTSQEIYPIPYEAQKDPVLSFTQATFEPYLKTEFRAQISLRKIVRLQLVRVEDRRTLAQKKNRETTGKCFALLFKASEELSPLQQTYVLDHDALGRFSLFLVNASDDDGIFYEAVINHIIG